MRTLIFSDTHLTEQFNEKQYNFLKRIIEEHDQVIINGDFWEAYFIDHKTFINSNWQKLFKLLISKKAIHVFGNHDNKKYMEDVLNIFATKHVQRMDIILGSFDLHIEHGHLIYSNEETQDFSRKNKLLLRVEIVAGIIAEKISMKILSKHQFTQFINNKIKTERKNLDIKENQILICGHTHCPEYNMKEKFINIGMIRYGYANYLSIDDTKDTIELKFERY